MGLAAAKQFAEDIFCKNRVVPLRTSQQHSGNIKEVAEAGGSPVPTLAEGIAVDNHPTLSTPTQRVAWENANAVLPHILTCCKKQMTSNVEPTPPPSANVKESKWKLESMDVNRVLSTVSPNAPWLLHPDTASTESNKTEQ